MHALTRHTRGSSVQIDHASGESDRQVAKDSAGW